MFSESVFPMLSQFCEVFRHKIANTLSCFVLPKGLTPTFVCMSWERVLKFVLFEGLSLYYKNVEPSNPSIAPVIKGALNDILSVARMTTLEIPDPLDHQKVSTYFVHLANDFNTRHAFNSVGSPKYSNYEYRMVESLCSVCYNQKKGYETYLRLALMQILLLADKYKIKTPYIECILSFYDRIEELMKCNIIGEKLRDLNSFVNTVGNPPVAPTSTSPHLLQTQVFQLQQHVQHLNSQLHIIRNAYSVQVGNSRPDNTQYKTEHLLDNIDTNEAGYQEQVDSNRQHLANYNSVYTNATPLLRMKGTIFENNSGENQYFSDLANRQFKERFKEQIEQRAHFSRVTYVDEPRQQKSKISTAFSCQRSNEVNNCIDSNLLPDSHRNFEKHISLPLNRVSIEGHCKHRSRNTEIHATRQRTFGYVSDISSTELSRPKSELFSKVLPTYQKVTLSRPNLIIGRKDKAQPDFKETVLCTKRKSKCRQAPQYAPEGHKENVLDDLGLTGKVDVETKISNFQTKSRAKDKDMEVQVPNPWSPPVTDPLVTDTINDQIVQDSKLTWDEISSFTSLSLGFVEDQPT